jgi:hypothetical protein
MQTLTGARIVDGGAGRAPGADPAAVDAVLTASRSMVAVATRSLGAAAEETTIAQYRALVVLASRGPRRIADLAEALDVAPSTAGRMGDRLVRKGLSEGTGRAATAGWSWCRLPRRAGRWSTRPPAGAAR